jgi:putative oxidoreductase
MFTFLEPFSSKLLAILRIVTGLLFMEHGTQKWLHFPAAPVDPTKPPAPPISIASLPGVAGIMELVGGFLIILGLFTRPVAFLLSGEMAVAYWMAHAKRGPFPVLNGGDAAILFCFVFLYLAAAGAGEWSLDRIMGKSRV